MSDEELKAELVKKAKAAGIWNAQPSWSVETLERKIAEKATEDPTEAPEPALEGDDEPATPREPEEVEEAAEEAPEPEQEIPEGDGVLCRVTKKGKDRISNGEGGYFDWKDMVRLPIEIAGPLEDRGYVEIEE